MKKLKCYPVNLLRLTGPVLLYFVAIASLVLSACAARPSSSAVLAQGQSTIAKKENSPLSAQPEVTFRTTSLGVLFMDCDQNFAEGTGFISATGQRISAFSRSFVSRAAAVNHLKCRMKNAQKIISEDSLYDDSGKIIGKRIIISALDTDGFEATGRQYVELMWTNDTSFHSVTGDTADAVLAFQKWVDWINRVPDTHP